jgi:hypothetical protein
MSDLTPVLQEMAARPDATEMLMPHEIRRAGERRRVRLVVVTATCVVAVLTVAAGVMRAVTRDAASVGPAGKHNPIAVETIHSHLRPILHRPGRPGGLPPGTYRYTESYTDLLGVGASKDHAHLYSGVRTWTLGDGRWSYQFTPSHSAPGGTGIHCDGYYNVVGDHIEFSLVTPGLLICVPPTWESTWSRTQAGGLQMRHIKGWQPHPNYLFGGKRWERVSN